MAVRTAFPAIPSAQWAAWTFALAAVAVLTVFASIYPHFPGDPAAARLIQDVELPWLEVLSTGVYYLGLWPYFALAALAGAVVFLCTRQGLAASFLLLTVGARLTSSVIKELAERPRPTSSLVDVTEQADGFSFPSRHVLGSVLLWGFLFYLASRSIRRTSLRLAVQALSFSAPLLMGLQRVYAGAHWPSDVLGGYVWGALVLFVLIQAYRVCERKMTGPLRLFGR